MRRAVAPALLMALLGGGAYAVVAWRGGPGAGERPRVEVAAHRLDAMVQGYVADTGRPPSAAEVDAMVEALIDEEVLLRYALELGMHQHSAAQTRLAQIADFVEANPHGAHTEAERAEAAVELGLHHGDLVVRRILTDSARRLIRAPALLQKPSPRQLADFLAANPEEFSRPGSCRISQVAVNGFKWPDTAARATALLDRIRAESLDVPAALALADASVVPAELPPLGAQALATQFGYEFASAVMALPVGAWSAPIPSRHGHHLVFVHARTEPRVPPLDQVAGEVEERLRQKLADEWLRLRLQELRLEYDVVAPGRPS